MSSSLRAPQLITWAVVLGGATSCASQESGGGTTRSIAAEQVVDRYLTQASIGVAEVVDSVLFSCDVDGASDNVVALANHRLLASTVAGDTAFVQAEIVAVARLRLANDGAYEVLPATTVDTLAWRLYRRGDNMWGICGYAERTGVDFVILEDLPRIRWLDESSIESLLERADSAIAR